MQLPPQVLLLGEPNTGKSYFLPAASVWNTVPVEESQRTTIACTNIPVTLETNPSSTVPLVVWKSDVKACHLMDVVASCRIPGPIPYGERNGNRQTTTTDLLNQILQMDVLSSILLFYNNRASYDAIRSVYIPLLLHWAGKMSFRYAGDERTPRERERDRNSPIERRGDASWPPIILVANNLQSTSKSTELKESEPTDVVTMEEGLELAEWIRTQHPESQCTTIEARNLRRTHHPESHCFDYRSNKSQKYLQPMRLEAGTLADVKFVEINTTSQSNCIELLRMVAAVSARSYMERRFAEVLSLRTRSRDIVNLCKAAVLDNAHTCARLLATQRKLMHPSSTQDNTAAKNADVADGNAVNDTSTDLPAWNTSWVPEYVAESNFKEWVQPDPEVTVLSHSVFTRTSNTNEVKEERSQKRCIVS